MSDNCRMCHSPPGASSQKEYCAGLVLTPLISSTLVPLRADVLGNGSTTFERINVWLATYLQVLGCGKSSPNATKTREARQVVLATFSNEERDLDDTGMSRERS
jgi:hypothetical protein